MYSLNLSKNKILKYLQITFKSLLLVFIVVFSFAQIPIPNAWAASVSWVGGTDANWSTAANWSTGVVPTASDDVLIDISATINIASSTTINSLVLGDASATYSPILNFNYNAATNGALTITGGDLHIYPGGQITHTAGTSAIVGTIYINVTSGNIVVDSGGSINVTGKGYAKEYGPGKPTGTGSGWPSAGGAGYGGGGGMGTLSTLYGGPTYGSITNPTDIGSGGSTYGGAGGGLIKLYASNTLTNNGTIASNGTDGEGNASFGGDGGGSGGTVNITAGTFAGGGTITSNGGNGGVGSKGYAGGAGGGRIAINYTSSTYTGTLISKGGTSNTAGRGGAPGSIFTKAAGTNGDLKFDNTSSVSAFVGKGYATISTNSTFDNVTLSNLATVAVSATVTITGTLSIASSSILQLESSANITYSTLSWAAYIIDNGGTMSTLASNTDMTVPTGATYIASTQRTFKNGTINGSISSLDNSTAETYKVNLTFTEDLTITSTGTVSLAGKGYTLGNGTGHGYNSSSYSIGGGGGAYGNSGGAGSGSGSIGGTSYGSESDPANIGSSGGYSHGFATTAGNGGGAITLSIGGTFTNNGAISVNGNPGTDAVGAVGGGGGSGGTVNITTNSFAGNGTIAANGGNGKASGLNTGGGGSGGRIAISTSQNSYTGSITATGGTGYVAGSTGTIYPNTITIDTPYSSSITQTTATIATNISAVPIANLSDTGFYWGTDSNLFPTVQPIHAYYFNEANDSDTPVDSIGSANGTVYGTTVTTGLLNNARSFSGSNNYITTGTYGFDYNYITVEAWVYINSLSARGTIIDMGTETSLVPSLEVGPCSGGSNTVCVIVPGTYEAQAANNSVTANQWVHIVYTKNGPGATNKLYVNGVAQTLSTNISATYNSTSVEKNIGRRGNAAQYFNGKIDNLKIYNQALSATDIAFLYNSGSGRETYVSAAVISNGILRNPGTISTNISSLTESTSYYFKPYVVYNGTNTFGNLTSFTTSSSNNTPTALGTNISGTNNIYAGKQINIQTIYSDEDGAADLDKLYLQVKNPSGTDIEYYATYSATDLTGQTPTNVSGASYISSITYDIDASNSTSNDTTVTWHITPGWSWTRDVTIQYGVKALDLKSASSSYDYNTSNYTYENRLTLTGSLVAKDWNNNILATGGWTKANSTVNFTGLKVVYQGTTDVYPNDNDFNVSITNGESQTWSDSSSSGENVDIDITTIDSTNSGDTYTFAITGIPTGGSDLSNSSFVIKTDKTVPTVSSLSSTTYINSTTWYTVTSGTFNWTATDSQSGIKEIKYLLDSSSSTSKETIIATGTLTSASSVDLSNITSGTRYLHLVVVDLCENSTSSTYSFKIDSPTPDIIAITGNNNNVWQNTDSGPVISWTDPSSLSDDTFYITNDGTTPTSTNYTYTTTSNSYDLPNQAEGETTIKVRDLNGAGTYSDTESFVIKYDNTAPTVTSLSSSTHTDQNAWTSVTSTTISWTAEDNQSGIYKAWRLLDQQSTTNDLNIMWYGIQDSASNSFSTTLSQDGTWYFHILVMDNKGFTTSKIYKINIDTQDPVISSITSTTHPIQTKWYASKSATVTWVTTDSGSGILGTWKLLDQSNTHIIAEVLTTGIQSTANATWTTPELTNGIWYVHLVTKDNAGKAAYSKYKLQIDSTVPNLVAVTGNNNNVWQNIDSGPVISWTDPASISDDTFYITNDGTVPTSTNYSYTTTSPTYDLPTQKEGETTIKVRALNGAGTYSDTKTFAIKYDTTAPANVSNLSANPSTSSITLTWQNPTNSDFNKVIIIRNSQNAPTSLTDGTKVYEGNLATYTDTNLSESTRYYYTVFAFDRTGNQSSGAVVQITTSPTATSQPYVPPITEQTKIVTVQDLPEEQTVSVTADQQQATSSDSGNIHVYTEQTIDITIPATTITSNTSDLKNVIFVVANDSYLMAYDAKTDTYKTTINAPKVKGTYDTKIQTISNENISDLAITMSLIVDPYGYIYSRAWNNEVRIANANVSLYKKVNNETILWSPSNGSTNPQITNSQGEYSFFVEPGEYKIVVEAKGYMTMETEWFTVESNIIERNIELTRNPYIYLGIALAAGIVISIGIVIIVKRKKHGAPI